MSALPYLPLWKADFLREIEGLAPEEIGAFALLLLHQWDNDGIPSEAKRLAIICRMAPAAFADAWEALSTKFPPHADGRRAHPGYLQQRAVAEARHLAAVDKAKRAASARHGKSREDAPSIATGIASSDAAGMPEALLGASHLISHISESKDHTSEAPPLPNGRAAPRKQGAPRLKPVGETPMVALPPEIEPYVTAMLKHMAAQRNDGLLGQGIILRVRERFRKALADVDGEWQYVAYGVQEALAKPGTSEGYAAAASLGQFRRRKPPLLTLLEEAENAPAKPVAEMDREEYIAYVQGRANAKR